MKKIFVKATLAQEMLGTLPSDPNIHEDFIASKAPDAPTREEEIMMIGAHEMVMKDKTIFPRNKKGEVCIYDYLIKGFFKEACAMLSRIAEKDPVTGKKSTPNESSKLKAFKKIIDGHVFIYPRYIKLNFDGEIGNYQRPLRAQTAQGERVALANSETVPEGTTLTFEIRILNDALEKAVIEWLDYGEYKGLGQWRNAGMGKFTYEIISESEYKELNK